MTLLIDGRRQSSHSRSRRLIVVDGRNIWLTQNDYIFLHHLADWQTSKTDRREWVSNDTWHPALRENLNRYAYVLREALAKGKAGFEIGNRVNTGYRIELPVTAIKMRPKSEYGAMLSEVWKEGVE